MLKNRMRVVHLGENLLEKFMKPSDPAVSHNMLAKAIDDPARSESPILSRDNEESQAICQKTYQGEP